MGRVTIADYGLRSSAGPYDVFSPAVHSNWRVHADLSSVHRTPRSSAGPGNVLVNRPVMTGRRSDHRQVPASVQVLDPPIVQQ